MGMWTRALVEFWAENYYSLRSYELLPFERQYTIVDIPIVGGSRPDISPYEETCDMNWEFDKALKTLNDARFKAIYIDGIGKRNKGLFDKFLGILEAENE